MKLKFFCCKEVSTGHNSHNRLISVNNKGGENFLDVLYLQGEGKMIDGRFPSSRKMIKM